MQLRLLRLPTEKRYSSTPPSRRAEPSAGNQALQRHLRPSPSLPVAYANDALEREADRTADHVMHAAPANIAPRRVARPTADAGGQPLDSATRAWFEVRFGRDFRGVRVQTGAAADRAARDIAAQAFTVGESIAFADGAYDPHSPHGRRVLAHELSHVAQNQAMRDGGGRGTGGGPRVSPAAPAVRRLLNPGPMQFPMGTLTITGDADPLNRGQLGSHEQVEITFAPKPFPASPVTSKIDFTQIARSPEGELGQPSLNRDDAIKDRARTTAGAAAHLTVAGDTTQSVSIAHFGDATHANAILQANTGQLTWWLAQSQPGGDNTTRPLPVGVTLSVPNAVAGGYVQDIDPVADYSPKKLVQPRTAPTDPAIPGAYPHMKRVMLTGGYMGPVYGYNRADGSSLAATMIDTPGGGPFSGTFAFETYAHSEDLGITYGGVRWGFQYGYRGITGEYAAPLAVVSDTAKAAMVAFNRTYRNDHVAQAGDTLNSLALMYYGDASHAGMIYQMNRTVLSTADPSAPIPPGTRVKVGTGPTIWDRAATGSLTGPPAR